MIAFTTPLLLLGLIALPILWLLLRAIPPAPIKRRFPGVALLLGLEDTDREADKTPLWLLMLRALAIAARASIALPDKSLPLIPSASASVSRFCSAVSSSGAAAATGAGAGAACSRAAAATRWLSVRVAAQGAAAGAARAAVRQRRVLT